MSKLNGLGGGWINCGLPTFISMERKPKNVCEIQNVCCARSRIMIQIKLVGHDTADESDGLRLEDDNAAVPHSVNVIKTLIVPWFHDGERILTS